MRRILPKLFALITRHDRYIPELEWNHTLWTYNIFRVYEQIFGRRFGVKAETTVFCDAQGNTNTKCHSWESAVVHIEVAIRGFFKGLVPVRVYVPAFATPMGMFSSQPYLFAIAYDTSIMKASATTTTPATWTHTTTGSNVYMYSCGLRESGTAGNVITSMSYNSVDMGANIGTHLFTSGQAGTWACFNLVAPASGAHTVSFAFTGSDPMIGTSMTFSGAAQSGQPDAAMNAQHNTAQTSWTMNITVNAANSVMAMIGASTAGLAWTAGANTTVGLQIDAAGQGGTCYSGANAAGARTMVLTSSSQNYQTNTISIAPFTASGPANLKSLDSNLAANVKSYLSNLIANVKSINTNA